MSLCWTGWHGRAMLHRLAFPEGRRSLGENGRRQPEDLPPPGLPQRAAFSWREQNTRIGRPWGRACTGSADPGAKSGVGWRLPRSRTHAHEVVEGRRALCRVARPWRDGHFVLLRRTPMPRTRAGSATVRASSGRQQQGRVGRRGHRSPSSTATGRRVRRRRRSPAAADPRPPPIPGQSHGVPDASTSVVELGAPVGATVGSGVGQGSGFWPGGGKSVFETSRVNSRSATWIEP